MDSYNAALGVSILTSRNGDITLQHVYVFSFNEVKLQLFLCKESAFVAL